MSARGARFEVRAALVKLADRYDPLADEGEREQFGGRG
jgi:hypothetical protein